MKKLAKKKLTGPFAELNVSRSVEYHFHHFFTEYKPCYRRAQLHQVVTTCPMTMSQLLPELLLCVDQWHRPTTQWTNSWTDWTQLGQNGTFVWPPRERSLDLLNTIKTIKGRTTEEVKHCTLPTIHCILHTEHYTLHTAYCTLNTTHCILLSAHYSMHSTSHTAHSTLLAEQFTQHTAHWYRKSAHCTLSDPRNLL